MKKRVLAVLAATALVGVASAYAANPFADVPTSSWAYQAVTQLAEQGVVIGYPDGYFKGQRNITRYEMAQIIARAMTRADRIDAQQQAMINKLAAEYATELRNLGVRVDELENRIGNVKLTGDARVRYSENLVAPKFEVADMGQAVKQFNEATPKGVSYVPFAKNIIKEAGVPFINPLVKPEAYSVKELNKTAAKWDARARLHAKAQINGNTVAGARIVMNTGIKEASRSDVTFDRLYVGHNTGNFSLMAGRLGLLVGDGLTYDDTFDGVIARTDVKGAGLMIGYGYPKELNVATELPYKNGADNHRHVFLGGNLANLMDNPTAGILQVEGKIGNNASIKGYYVKGLRHLPANYYGASIHASFKNFWIGGEWAKFDFNDDMEKVKTGWTGDKSPKTLKDAMDFYDIDATAWTVGIGVGNYDQSKAGTFGARVQYFHEGLLAPVFSSTYNQPLNQSYKGYAATVDYALSDGLGLTAVYNFNGETLSGHEVDDTYKVSLNYKF